jgi:hypothetical protein
MTYEKLAWTTTTLRSARNMVHLETQYSEMKTIIDAHSHDERYFTKAVSDTTFYSTSYMGLTGLPDADLLDGVHATALLSNTMPIGAVMWWSGTDANIPANWHICDGSGGTPDLRGKFIIGAGGAYSPGATGGAATITPTATVTIATHALTSDEIPSHSHSITDHYNSGSSGSAASSGASQGTYVTARTTGNPDSYGTAHGHAGSTLAVNQINKLPRWKSYYLMMKVS